MRIVTSQNSFDIRGGEAVDLENSFGEGQWPGCDAREVLPELVVSVCAPAWLEQHAQISGTATDVLRLPLLHLSGGGQNRWMTWQDWARL